MFLDIDECSTVADICDINAVCKNTQGSYTCTCKAGYTGDGQTCSGKIFCVYKNILKKITELKIIKPNYLLSHVATIKMHLVPTFDLKLITFTFYTLNIQSFRGSELLKRDFVINIPCSQLRHKFVWQPS